MVPQAYLDSLRPDTWVPTFKNWFETDAFRTVILYDGGTAAGCITYGRARDEECPDWGEIVSLYVLPERQCKGYGRKLMAHALKQLEADGYGNAYLWALKENHKARAFYEKNGFVWRGEESRVEIMGEKLADLRYVRPLGPA